MRKTTRVQTEVFTAGRGDDFTAFALCSGTVCDWSHRELLTDDGDMGLTVHRAEHAAQQHLLTAH